MPLSGKLADPAWRTERARKAAAASNTTDALIRRFMRRLDELTPEQIDVVRRALPPVSRTESGEVDAA